MRADFSPSIRRSARSPWLTVSRARRKSKMDSRRTASTVPSRRRRRRHCRRRRSSASRVARTAGVLAAGTNCRSPDRRITRVTGRGNIYLTRFVTFPLSRDARIPCSGGATSLRRLRGRPRRRTDAPESHWGDSTRYPRYGGIAPQNNRGRGDPMDPSRNEISPDESWPRDAASRFRYERRYVNRANTSRVSIGSFGENRRLLLRIVWSACGYVAVNERPS